MPPEVMSDPAAATVVVIADWSRLRAEERVWLTELTVGSLGWGSRFGEEFAPVIVGVDASDDSLPSGVAMYAIGREMMNTWKMPTTVRVAVALGPIDGAASQAIAETRAAKIPVVRPVSGKAIGASDWCVCDAAALIDTVFALQAGETPARATQMNGVAAGASQSTAATLPSIARSVVPDTRVVFEPPPVSLVIPTWNRAGYLRETIVSCLAQDYPRCTVIVADDGSTDGTAEMVRGLSNNGVQLVSNAHAGAPSNRNQALAVVGTPFVVWVGDDDVLAPSVVRNRIAMLERVPDADVIHGDILVCNAQLQPQSQNTGEDWSTRPQALVAVLFQRNVIADGGSLISMRAYARAGWYDDAFPKGHDYHLWSRLALRAKFVYDAGVGYLWRWHGANMGLGGGANPYADAHRRIVLAMWARYDRRLLFPDVPWEQIPGEQREGVSALLMAERLVREEAWADAHRFAQVAVTLGLSDANELARRLALKLAPLAADAEALIPAARSHLYPRIETQTIPHLTELAPFRSTNNYANDQANGGHSTL